MGAAICILDMLRKNRVRRIRNPMFETMRSAIRPPHRIMNLLGVVALIMTIGAPMGLPTFGLIIGSATWIAYVHCAVNLQHLVSRINPLVNGEECSVGTRFKALNLLCIAVCVICVLLYIGIWAADFPGVQFPELTAVSAVPFALVSILPFYIVMLMLFYGTYKVNTDAMTLASFATILLLFAPIIPFYMALQTEFGSIYTPLDIPDALLIAAAVVMLIATAALEAFVRKNATDTDDIETDNR